MTLRATRPCAHISSVDQRRLSRPPQCERLHVRYIGRERAVSTLCFTAVTLLLSIGLPLTVNQEMAMKSSRKALLLILVAALQTQVLFAGDGAAQTHPFAIHDMLAMDRISAPRPSARSLPASAKACSAGCCTSPTKTTGHTNPTTASNGTSPSSTGSTNGRNELYSLRGVPLAACCQCVQESH